MLADSDRLADELLARHRQAIIGGEDSPLPPEEAREYVRWIVRAFLGGIRERRQPAGEEITRCEGFGARHARHGLTASAVAHGHLLGHRELWQRVIEEVLNRSGVDPAPMATMFVYSLQWLDAVISAINRGFQVQAFETHSARERAHRQLVTLLETGPADGDTVRSLVAGLDLDPEGMFVAVHGRGACPGNHNPVPADYPETRLVQGEDVAKVLGRPVPGERWGIGAARRGLPGAQRSIVDAKLAYAALPDRGGRMDFADSWYLCLARAHREAIDPLMETTREVARSRPHLLDAVVAFADARFSVTSAARALLVHPNTLSYRLDQWQRLTTLDPRTVTGLAQSLYVARVPSPKA
ncbi:hypothetical protein GTS_44090 [Gandjariella thermophila]|uniref:Uncharacterized protein n=1 Tax=Gandjariella thermophila TaxID=1931992 RepID=A0A4D4JEI3_9PSEU|nr:hypothetical protein GTS_44090 [Gandjariella thermophila]